MGAFTVERSYSVMAGGSLVARSAGAIINVLTAVVPSPAVHAHTLVATISVVTRAPILAGIRHQLALIDVLRAELTCGRPRRRVQTETPNLQTAGSAFFVGKNITDLWILGYTDSCRYSRHPHKFLHFGTHDRDSRQRCCRSFCL